MSVFRTLFEEEILINISVFINLKRDRECFYFSFLNCLVSYPHVQVDSRCIVIHSRGEAFNPVALTEPSVDCVFKSNPLNWCYD